MPLTKQGTQNVKAILDEATADKKSGSPGLVFVAIDKRGTLIEHASGTRGVNASAPIDFDTVFWIASCTKIVTSIALLQLVEQGRLSLDDADQIKKYAPEIGKKQVFADGVNGIKQEKDVTLRMLLAHTAGFAYAFLDPRVSIHSRPVGVEEFQGDVQDILNSPMVNQPGSMWEYGINIDWAGIVLERVTGERLNDYFQKHIFQPLGIRDVDMFPTESMTQNLAYMHQRDVDGNLQERDHLYRRAFLAKTDEDKDKFFQSGGAGLFAKPTEYIKVLAALLHDGKSPTTGAQILRKETVDLMWENQIPNQPNFARGGPAPAQPLLANPSPETYPQEGNPPQGWGLSMFLTIEPAATGRGRNTGWWAGISNQYWWVDRERGVAGFIASQVLPFGDPKVVPTWVTVEKAVYDGLEAASEKPSL